MTDMLHTVVDIPHRQGWNNEKDNSVGVEEDLVWVALHRIRKVGWAGWVDVAVTQVAARPLAFVALV